MNLSPRHPLMSEQPRKIEVNLFPNTRAALKVYDLSVAARESMWFEAMTDLAVYKAQAADAEALALVQEAFYQDTKHLNSRGHCAIADIGFMRQCAGLGEEGE